MSSSGTQERAGYPDTGGIILGQRLVADSRATYTILKRPWSPTRLALTRLGYQPTLVTTDGYTGLPEGAPYDRILATYAITHIPPE